MGIDDTAPDDSAADDAPTGAGTHRELDPVLLAGAPRRLALIGGALLAISATFPWFTAGAIATEPFEGRALVALVLGLAVVVSTEFAERWTHAWQVTMAVTTVTGIVLVAVSAVAPPRSLGPSTGVALALVGSLLAGLALFAARWRRQWAPPASASAVPGSAGTDGEPDDEPASVPADTATETEVDTTPPPARRSRTRRILRGTAIVLAVALGVVVLWPAPTPTLEARPDPTVDHDGALERFADVTAGEAEVVYEPCESQLLTHGERTEVAVVLFHGLTNCPQQFAEFGNELFDAGANVLILRAPEHGIANADGTGVGGVGNVSDLTAELLRDYADDAVDIAAGLGDEVRVLGLSMGGVIATWTAQHRSDVDRVVAVAPAISIPGVPAVLTHLFRNVFGKLPNLSLPSPGARIDHAYHGETTKGLDATFDMAASVADSAYASPPAAGDVVVVLNPNDNQVDPNHLSEFADAWASAGGPVILHRLPAVGLRHDVIDLDQPDARPELVYPILLALLEGDRP